MAAPILQQIGYFYDRVRTAYANGRCSPAMKPLERLWLSLLPIPDCKQQADSTAISRILIIPTMSMGLAPDTCRDQARIRRKIHWY